MSQRLTELQRQRALLQEHLAWLDREIAAAQSAAPTAPLPTAVTPLRDVRSENPVLPAPTPPSELPPDVEKLVAEHRRDPASLQQDTRRGCLMIFWIVLGGTLLLTGIAYLLYVRHLGRWW